MTLMGFYGEEPRLPLLPLDPSQRDALNAVFQAAGLIEAVQQAR
jgi:dihydrodipicolinate synthase/N-acetylneuraminate lyase